MGASDDTSFQSLLREKLEELDTEERSLEEDPLVRFSAAAHRLLLAETGGPLPRSDHGAYSSSADRAPGPMVRTLDITS